MNIRETLEKDIRQRIPGEIFTYQDIGVPSGQTITLIKALSTFYKQGVIKRLSKGLYYIPQQTEFGELPPSTSKTIQRVLAIQGATVGYMTGINAYSNLVLTTQLSTEVVIATDKPRSPIKIGGTKIRFVESRIKQQPSNVLLPQLLDAFSDIKSIPDAEPTSTLKIILGYLRKLSLSGKQEIVQLASQYPPSTQALLGLCFDVLGELTYAQQLQAELNPITTYRIGIKLNQFATSLRWNIL